MRPRSCGAFLRGARLSAHIREHSGISIKPISVFGSRPDRRVGLRLRQGERPRQGHRGPQGQHHEVLRRPLPRASRARWPSAYPDIEFEDRIIDNLCNQLVSRPEEYDVIVLPNLYGDIVSDLGAGMIGGLGLAPGANIGTEAAMFEATHGSAPKYKGQNKVNPTALHALRRADAAPPGRARGRGPHGERHRRGHPQGREGDLRPQAHARRPDAPSAPPSSPTRSSRR